MRTYSCPYCRCKFSEADKSWDVAVDSGQCPECLEPLRNFAIAQKRQEEKSLAQQPEPQEESPAKQQKKSENERPVTQQPFQWGCVISWGLSAFLFGLTTAHPPLAWDSINRSALRLFVGVVFAIFTAVIVGSYKCFKRDSNERVGTAGGSQSADKAVFWFSAVLATFFVAVSLYLKHYIGLLDAGACGLLGIGVRNGIAASRWLLAGYAFLSPIIVVLSTGSPSGALWPFLFFAACRSILAHQKKSQLDAANGIAMGNASEGGDAPATDATHKKIDQTLDDPNPAITRDSGWGRQYSEDSSSVRVQAIPPGISKAMSSSQPTANPIAAVSISVESGQSTTALLEDRLYEQIAQELETNTADKGLWTKAYAQAGGDDRQTRVLYIKMRFARLLAMEKDQRGPVRKEKE